MAEDDLRTLIEEALLDYDPEIDLSSGSPAQAKIVDRIIDYAGVDPFDTDMVEFIKTRLSQEFTQLGEENATAISDLLIKPFQTLITPIVREIDLMKKRQSVKDLSVHTEESVDGILANIFMDRELGEYSQGQVRIFYTAPRFVLASADTRFYDGEGHNFYPLGDQNITQRQMIFKKIGDEYYFDVLLVASSPGEDYNVEPGAIKYVEGLPGVKRITNRFRFQSGLDRETNELFLQRAENYPTEAALNARRGIFYVIQQNFPSIDQIEVVGYGDEEMQRDKLTGMGYGPVAAHSVLGGISTSPVEDGDYDDNTDLLQDTTINFPAVIGATGDITDRVSAQLIWQDLVSAYHIDEYEVVEVVDTDIIRISDKIPVQAVDSMILRFHSISISDIPGGFAFPNQNEVRDGVHIGGSIDIYVKDPTPSESEVDMTLLSDETYVYISDDVEITSTERFIDLHDVDPETVHENTIGLKTSGTADIILEDIAPGATFYAIPQDLEVGDVIYVAALGKYYEILALDTSTYASTGLKVSVDASVPAGPMPPSGYGYEVLKYHGSIRKGMIAYLLGGEPGNYRIFYGKGTTNTGTNDRAWLRLIVNYVFTVSASGLGCRIYDDVEINLTEPKSVKIEDTDLTSVMGSSIVTSSTGHDFDALGVQPDDVLRITAGPNEEDYTILAVVGGGNTQLELDRDVPFSVTSQAYSVFTLLTAVENPLLLVDSMEVLDASSQPTGVEVPIGQPLAGISSDFTNMSRGGRYDTREGIVGVYGRAEGTTGFPITGKDLRLRFTFPNNASSPLLYTPVTAEFQVAFVAGSYPTAASVVADINTAIASLGAAYAYDIEGHVAIRPLGDTLIEVITPVAATDAAADLGYITNVTKSNGILLPDDPESVGINASSDYCYISSGPNGGDLYIIESIDGTNKTIYLDSSRAFLKPTDEDHVVLGFLSTGNVRFYFRDSTYFEVNQATQFVVDDDGVIKTFIPDPTLKFQVFPTDQPKSLCVVDDINDDVEVTGLDIYNYLIETYVDDQDQGLVRRGDLLDLTYRRLWFNDDLFAGIPAWTSPATMKISVGSSNFREIDLDDLPAPTLDDLVTLINDEFTDLASKIVISGAPDREYLVLDSEEEIKIETDAAGNFEGVIGTPTPGYTNRCANFGLKTAQGFPVDEKTVHVEESLVVEDINIGGDTSDPEVQCQIYRPGAQRICTTDLATQTQYGYYYADMEFVSLGVGDQFNIAPGLYGTTTGYKCYGYRLRNTNSALAFSTEEEVFAIITSQILEPDVECSPVYERLIAGSNIRVNYIRSPIAEDIQVFVSADTERVVNASVISKHFIPAYIKATLSYTGLINEDDAYETVKELIEGITPDERLEVSDITAVLINAGANYVQTPVVLVPLYQDEDREMYIKLVTDAEDLSRLVTYFIDELTLSRL